MISKNFHKAIRIAVVVILVLFALWPVLTPMFNYAVALAFIYLVWRTPLEYTT